jgi:hypothetical protein
VSMASPASQIVRVVRAVLVLSALLVTVSFHVGHASRTSVPYVVPRTPWGDPDLQGAYSNSAERLTPMERPESLAGRRLSEITPAELTRLNKERLRTSALQEPRFEDSIDGSAWSSRAWLIVDPDDGKIPPSTTEARMRTAARIAARRRRGPADSWTDFDLFSRCITRGLPSAMIPVIYGNTYEIVQAPGSVAIVYELLHETRVIPLDERPDTGSRIGGYMGDSRGHFEGDTLVVETTNLRDTPFLGAGPDLHITERFIPLSAEILEWRVTVNDPHTWIRPWTFAMSLTRGSARPLEFACHEGNYSMRHALSAARAEEQ